MTHFTTFAREKRGKNHLLIVVVGSKERERQSETIENHMEKNVLSLARDG